MTESTNPAASTVQPGRLASIRMWVGANVRRVAHTVEFFFVGLVASVIVVCFSRRPWSVCSRCVPVFLFCAACSVGDQVHKIFVPGRHFDVIDLGFDAAGYVTAMLLVLQAAALVQPCDSADRRPCEALAGNKPVSDNATLLNYFVSRVFPSGRI